MVKPNIFLVGVQKAGTTSLYHYLRGHPDIYGPEIKDYNNSHPFFSNEEFFQKKRTEFEKLFNKNPGKMQVITSEVEWIENKAYLKRIKEYNPEAKIIVSLRNPIDRLRSMISFYEQTGKNLYENREEELEKLSNDYLKRSLYYQKIKDLYEVFDASKIQVIFFEDFTGKKFDQVINQLFDFIQVDRSSKNFLHENKTRRIRSRIIDKTLKMGRGTKARKVFVHSILDKFLDANNRAKLKKKVLEWNLTDGTKPKKEIKINQKVRDIIVDDVQKLGELLNMKLVDYWSLNNRSQSNN